MNYPETDQVHDATESTLLSSSAVCASRLIKSINSVGLEPKMVSHLICDKMPSSSSFELYLMTSLVIKMNVENIVYVIV